MDPVLALGEDRLHVEPGGEARTTATVRNVGELVEQYRLEVLGDAARWAQVVPRQISVVPGRSEEKTVEVVFRPPPPPAVVAGEIPFGLRCVSLEGRDRCAVVEGDLVVGAVHGVQAHLEPVSPSGRWTGRYRVVFDNTGSVAAQLRLAAADTRRMLRCALAPPELTVEPGRPASAYLAVRPRQPKLRGKPVPHAFAVTYQSTGTGSSTGTSTSPGRGVELAGTFEQRPVVSKGLMIACLLLVLAAGALGVLLLRQAGDGGGAEPAAITGPPPPIALTAAGRLTDTSVQLVWQRSPYATGYVVQQLLPDGNVAGSKEIGDRDQSALAWDGLLPGKHCFRVIAVGQAGRSSPSKEMCAVLTKPTPTPAPSPTGGPAPTGAPPPTAPPATPGGGADPVQGAYYVIYANPWSIKDTGVQGRAEAQALAARLQGRGSFARVVNSLDSKRLGDGPDGFWVVLRDGFASQEAADAECAAQRPVAPDCIVDQ